ncbi:Lactose permease [Fusarium oxysporum f. sp. albedinis]|nr:Lactose permease [Fusarium oxysporum f. sp. albedinis]
MWVHMPVLRHAFSSYRPVRIDPALSTEIASNFIPITKGKAAIAENDMIDFTLLLWLNSASPCTASHDTILPEKDVRLMAGIAKAVWKQPFESQFSLRAHHCASAN